MNRDDRHMQEAGKRMVGHMVGEVSRGSDQSTVMQDNYLFFSLPKTNPSYHKPATLVFFSIFELSKLIPAPGIGIGTCSCHSLQTPLSSPRRATYCHSGLNSNSIPNCGCAWHCCFVFYSLTFLLEYSCFTMLC